MYNINSTTTGDIRIIYIHTYRLSGMLLSMLKMMRGDGLIHMVNGLVMVSLPCKNEILNITLLENGTTPNNIIHYQNISSMIVGSTGHEMDHWVYWL